MGRVRSLDRTVIDKRGGIRVYKGEILNGTINYGYKIARFSKNGKNRTFHFSQLVAMAFLNHNPDGHKIVVDHRNGVRSDDRVENLRIVTHRDNLSTCFRIDKEELSSKYAGVTWHIIAKKWMASITNNGVYTFLGYFTDELEASDVYQNVLSKINDGTFNLEDYKPKFTSKYKGVTFQKSRGKWVAKIRENGRNKYLGSFNTELEAHNAYQSELNKQMK